MLSIEEKLIARKADLNRAGVTSAVISETIKNCSSDEQRLNALLEYDANPFTKHNEKKRVMRHNGSGVVTESDGNQELVKHMVANCGVTESEARTILGQEKIIDEKITALKALGFSEADAKIVIDRGYFFQE
jgi:hypothetical protein